jgi:pimeloyl-ACP methyl ester carboxylesterase
MLYYIHGYQSSPTSTKGTLFKKTLHAIPIRYRDGNPEDLVITDCLKRISETIQNDDNVVLIGSSLGGFLAASTALSHPNVKRLILLNPAMIPPKTDLSTIQGMPQRILIEMMNPRLFEQKIGAAIAIVRGTEDTVVPDDWILSFAQAQEATLLLLNDDHRFTKNLEQLPGIITELLQK